MLTRETEQRQAIEIHDFAVDVIGILRGYVSRKIILINEVGRFLNLDNSKYS